MGYDRNFPSWLKEISEEDELEETERATLVFVNEEGEEFEFPGWVCRIERFSGDRIFASEKDLPRRLTEDVEDVEDVDTFLETLAYESPSNAENGKFPYYYVKSRGTS
jgi:hypothetical protein